MSSVPPAQRLPLRRPTSGRRLGGIAAGLAAHLGLRVGLVRMIFVGTSLVAGVGAAFYVFLWVTVPVGDPQEAAASRPASLSRLAPRLRQDAAGFPVAEVGVGLLLVLAAAVLVASRQGIAVGGSWLVPALIVLGGTALAWSQLDAVSRGATSQDSRREQRTSILRLIGGSVLAGLGVFLFVGRETRPMDMLGAAVAAIAVAAGVGLVLAPWWLRLVRALGDERSARAREAERADIAAHLHDSVLQTLALIRARAGDPEDVARLARAQERELRSWLYEDRASPGTSLAAELARLVGEVEDQHAVPVEVVVVGDRVPDAETEILLRATREALLNAVRHGRPPVSVYLECRPELVEAFVRDHGDGFDPDAVPVDRLGIRESIVGRMTRHGGTAAVRCRESGTEVHLSLPVDGDEEARP
ncbi:PspC domain-containing protein [Actinotalea sp.]|uniref:ATP-binding protein n=1 Tax=Actinotalea sp. TaxID=1872145 RepID=UPI00356577F7